MRASSPSSPQNVGSSRFVETMATLVSWLGSASVYESVLAARSTSVTTSRKWTLRSSFSVSPIWRKSSGA